MPNGKLGAADLTADTYTTVYTVPASTVASVNWRFCNRGEAPATVRVAFTTEASAPLNEDFVEYDAVVPGKGGILESTAIVAGAGEKVMARSSTGDVSIRVHGFEEAE